MATVRSRRKAGTRRARRTSPSPFTPSWTPRPAQFGHGVHHNVAVTMSDGVVLRADIHYPTVPGTGQPAAGPFPVLLCLTPYGKKAPPPAAQIGGGATPYLIKRGYIEVMVDVRGSGVSGGSFEMFGERQTQDGIELVDWASKLPNANGRVGMFGIVLPGDQPAVHRCRHRAGFAAEGDFPGDGRPRFLSRCGGHGRCSAPAHRTGLRGDLSLTQRRQPGTGGDQPRQASAAAGRRVRRGAEAWA